ncbi:hypothetical protein P9578_07505 [Brevibacillus choshinensis]|nr:hypothetical protein [Brevibacillus choshinensis]MED4779749.1 hypothetical protein [Brevibacillus choshinensis]
MASSSIMRKLKLAASVAGEAAAKKVPVEQESNSGFNKRPHAENFCKMP